MEIILDCSNHCSKDCSVYCEDDCANDCVDDLVLCTSRVQRVRTNFNIDAIKCY